MQRATERRPQEAALHEMRPGNLPACRAMPMSDAARTAARTMTDQNAATLKPHCSGMRGRVADGTLQMRVGIGHMEQLPEPRLCRDARAERARDGTSETRRHIISRAILRPLGA